MEVGPLLEELEQVVARNPVVAASVKIVEQVAASVAGWEERGDQEAVQEITIAQIVVYFRSLERVVTGVVVVFALWNELEMNLLNAY